MTEVPFEWNNFLVLKTASKQRRKKTLTVLAELFLAHKTVTEIESYLGNLELAILKIHSASFLTLFVFY